MFLFLLRRDRGRSSIECSAIEEKKAEGGGVASDLPLILPARLMEDIFATIDREDAVFHDALPAR